MQIETDGRIYITSSTTTATTGFNEDPKDILIRQLQRQIEEQRRQIEQLQAEVKKAQNNNHFSEKEIRLLINKCHPDKNNGSTMCAQITDKLVKLKETFSNR